MRAPNHSHTMRSNQNLWALTYFVGCNLEIDSVLVCNANTHILIHGQWPGMIQALVISHKAIFDLCTSDLDDCRLKEKVGHKCAYGWIYRLESNAHYIKISFFSKYNGYILLINANCLRLSSCVNFGCALSKIWLSIVCLQVGDQCVRDCLMRLLQNVVHFNRKRARWLLV